MSIQTNIVTVSLYKIINDVLDMPRINRGI